MSDFRQIFSAMNEYEQFVCTMSTMSLEFSLMPEWVQNVAYTKYQETYQELMDMRERDPKITPQDIVQVMWSDSSRRRYFNTAMRANELGKSIQENLENLKDYDAVVDFFQNGEKFFLHQLEDDQLDDEHAIFWSIDIAGEIPVVFVKFDGNDHVTYMDVYQNPIDLETGDIHTYEQLGQMQAQQDKEERKSYQKPTGKQLTMARALCEQQGIEMPYFPTRQACSHFIEKLVEHPDEQIGQMKPQDQGEKESQKPTGKQLTMARALCEQQGIEMPYFSTRKACSQFIDELIHKTQAPEAPPRMADQLKKANQVKQEHQNQSEERAGTDQCIQI